MGLQWFERCEDAVHNDTCIKGFFEDYRYLSNFEECIVHFEGLVYQSSEAAYQSAKTTDFDERERFTTMTASVSKREGKKLKIREDWDEVKVGIMKKIVKDKFTRNQHLKEKLLATGDKYLEETNWWNDKFWGVCKGVGQNQLGLILMEVRNELKDE